MPAKKYSVLEHLPQAYLAQTGADNTHTEQNKQTTSEDDMDIRDDIYICKYWAIYFLMNIYISTTWREVEASKKTHTCVNKSLSDPFAYAKRLRVLRDILHIR